MDWMDWMDWMGWMLGGKQGVVMFVLFAAWGEKSWENWRNLVPNPQEINKVLSRVVSLLQRIDVGDDDDCFHSSIQAKQSKAEQSKTRDTSNHDESFVVLVAVAGCMCGGPGHFCQCGESVCVCVGLKLSVCLCACEYFSLVCLLLILLCFQNICFHAQHPTRLKCLFGHNTQLAHQPS